MKDFKNAEDWNKKVVELDPANKAAYYTLGVIAWTEFLSPVREAQINEKMKPEDPPPLKDAKEKEALKAKYWQSLTDGIEDEKKALGVDPMYNDAMAYMNLLIRYRAFLDDTKEQAAADSKEADDWVEKGSRDSEGQRREKGRQSEREIVSPQIKYLEGAGIVRPPALFAIYINHRSAPRLRGASTFHSLKPTGHPAEAPVRIDSQSPKSRRRKRQTPHCRPSA